jgi:hypothetical protein
MSESRPVAGEAMLSGQLERAGVVSVVLLSLGTCLLAVWLWALVGLEGLVVAVLAAVLVRFGSAPWAVFGFGQAVLLVVVSSEVTTRALGGGGLEPVTIGSVIGVELGLGLLLLSQGIEERRRTALWTVAVFVVAWLVLTGIGLLAWTIAPTPWFGAIGLLVALGVALYSLHRYSYVSLVKKAEAEA